MARCDDLSDEQRNFFQPLFSRAYDPELRGPGMPPASFCTVMNTILRVLFNGAKWNAVPLGIQWSPLCKAHRSFQN